MYNKLFMFAAVGSAQGDLTPKKWHNHKFDALEFKTQYNTHTPTDPSSRNNQYSDK